MRPPLRRLITESTHRLEAVGIERARGEVEWILGYLLDVERLQLFLEGDTLLADDHIRRLEVILERRLTRYPLQYILEEAWFYGRRFFVSPAVMIPTPETEVLCETAIRFATMKQYPQPRVLDLGAGSGVIAITMANELPHGRVVAVDISEEALDVARRNAGDLEVADRIDFRRSDLFMALRKHERYELILSNPPYISEPEYKDLPPEVLADPKTALVSGHDGLDTIREILRRAPDHLAPGGRMIFEIGYDQAEKVRALTEADERYRSIVIFKDLTDIDRVVMLSCD